MCYGDQIANVPNKLKKDDVPRKTTSLTTAEEAVVGKLAKSIRIQELRFQQRQRSQLTIDSQIDEAVANMYNEYGHKLQGPAVEDLANKPEESINETDDADESDIDLSHDTLHRDDDDARSHNNQDHPNNRKGKNKKKRQKDVDKPSSRSSRRNRSLVVILQDDTPIMQPLEKADTLNQKHFNPELFPKKSGLAKRRMTCFDLFLKSDIDKDENHILGPSTVTIAKRFKELI
uniref:Uncharacterized protein n=1 Tax=Tanacetum cinerariifolium TaxID=118510 RepID=A0A699J2D3_TANCI|nr:hypothetical protein [Tanacetum cinerariifolium]